MRMKLIGIGLLAALLAAAGTHLVLVLRLPGTLIEATMESIAGANGWNTIVHANRPPTAASRAVVMPGPDMVYSICILDLSDGPVQLTAQVPGSYWSVSVYDDVGNNTFVLSDREHGPGPWSTVIHPPDSPAVDHGIQAASTRGIAVFRYGLVGRDLASVQAVQRESNCERPSARRLRK